MASRLGPSIPGSPEIHGRLHQGPPSRDEVRSTINALYDAAGDVNLLQEAVAQVTACLRGHRANLLVRAGNTFAATPVFVLAHEMDPDIMALVAQEHYWERDLWSRGADRIGLFMGETVPGERLVGDTALKASEFYADILEPLEIPRLLVGIADKTPDDIIHMSVFGSDRRGPFTEDEHRAMKALLPAIRVATRSALQVLRYQLRAAPLEETLDQVQQAVFLVSGNGKVLSANAAAEELLSAQKDLTTAHGCLAARRAEDTRQIHTLLRAIATPGQAPDPAVIRDALGRPTLLLSAVPLRPAAQVHMDLPRSDLPVAAVFATTARPLSPAPAAILSSIYGLTPAEARLAEHLAEGAALAEVADNLNISRETARSQLKAIYRKTDTHRQSELVALVLSLGRGPRL